LGENFERVRRYDRSPIPEGSATFFEAAALDVVTRRGDL